jgi:2-keto-4-pentenoate hydratase/2-oxohepta-3-ene-1,7-dioic acid hydratase in catechol pathway
MQSTETPNTSLQSLFYKALKMATLLLGFHGAMIQQLRAIRLFSSKSVTTRISNMLIDKVGTKAVCVGRNYEKHAKEMGAAVGSTKGDPILFLKPTSSYLRGDHPILLPVGAQVHHEVELGVVIGKLAKRVSQEEAMNFVTGYVCCIDVTARNWQAQAKKEGTPWTISKGCDTFLPMSDLIPAQKVPNPRDLHLWLKVCRCVLFLQ